MPKRDSSLPQKNWKPPGRQIPTLTVVTTVAGVILYDYLNNDEENKEATDSV